MRVQLTGRLIAIKLVALAVGLAVAAVVSPAAMAENRAGWELNSHSYPTNLLPGSTGIVAVDVYNVGAAESMAGATVVDTLPVGLEGLSEEGWTCKGSAPSVCSDSRNCSI